MPPKRITLKAHSIDGAAEQIIHLLEDTDRGGDVIYFDGWSGGWGASAVLKEVVRRLRSSLGSGDTRTAGGLEKIIHVDFSRWQSKRALQKAIAEELDLPEQLMALFDQRDEEDDFDGVEQSARGVIPHVKLTMMKELNARRFLVVLHNWSGGYIELREVGVPLIGELGRRVLWTSSGRFWPHVTARHREEDVEELAGSSDVAISADLSPLEGAETKEIATDILYAEAKEIAKYTGVPEPDMRLDIVIECILYMAARGNDPNISWKSHASNYWVCDGIIQDATGGGGRSSWEMSDALQRNMNLDVCNHCALGICELLSAKQQQRPTDRWVSANSQNSKQVQVPPQATSFFWTAGGPSSETGHNGTSILEAGIFEHSDSLRVIHLSHCTFSFSSPPFLSCSNLRFLLLDHCKNKDTQQESMGEGKECHHHNKYSQQDGGSCFRNLWVLELSYTDWYWLLSKDMLDLMVDLRELNVKGVGNQSMMHLQRCSGAGSSDRRSSLIKLGVVSDDDSNNNAPSNESSDEQVSPPPLVAVVFFPDLSSWHILKTVILDGCGDLKRIDSNALPLQSLESFTLTSSVTASNKMESISFRGCAKLKHLLLRGLFGRLEELDMSGTAIKTLDLTSTQARGLRRLFLSGCEELCVIVCPQLEWISLEILRIDTTCAAWDRKEVEKSSKQQEASASDNSASIISKEGSSSAMVCGKDGTIMDSDSYIFIRDPRLFRSLESSRLGHRKYLHVKISSTGHKADTGQGINTSGGCGSAAGNVHKKAGGSLYADDIIIIVSTCDNASSSNSQATTDANNRASIVMRSKWLWGCPRIPTWSRDWAHCYISILQGGTRTITTTTLPRLVTVSAVTLHLHDSLVITCLPGPAPAAHLYWDDLMWCRLERCPNLEGCVFKEGNFLSLQTFWASQLPKARYIWDWSTTPSFRPPSYSFRNLVFLHIDDCPRLVHVLPLYASNTDGCRSLETLEIVCCGDLREVFPTDSESQQQQQKEEPGRRFPRLKRIHLYELPKLQRICGRRMVAPNLETVKIRGCWGLKRLPAVRDVTESSKSTEGMTPLSKVDLDCEKDWWDGLEWDDESAGHSPSHYKPTYSAYYKEEHLRASVLR